MSELMDIVDENDNVIGKATREKIHNSQMWHRGIHILVFNSEGKLLLPLRSSRKDKFPNTYDCSVSEHVKTGEKFEEAAIRGIKEELNIKCPKLKRLLKFRMKYGPNDNMISVIYECHYLGEIDINKIDRNEIKKIELLPLNEVREMLISDESKFAPWTREILKWYFNMPSKLERLE